MKLVVEQNHVTLPAVTIEHEENHQQEHESNGLRNVKKRIVDLKILINLLTICSSNLCCCFPLNHPLLTNLYVKSTHPLEISTSSSVSHNLSPKQRKSLHQ
jgi:formate-dependent phosphoribosylglycinamide formyltransferase (GAR transformylase)